MAQLLRYGAVQTAVFSGDLHRWAKIQKAGELPRFSYEVGKIGPGDPQGDSGHGASLRHLIQEAEPAQRQRILESYICTQLSKVLGTSPDKLPVEEPLLNLGVDSLMEIEMNLRIEKELGVRVPPMKFMELSIASMSKVVIEQLNVKDSDTELRE
jgi:acyl carrier protein